MMRWSRFVLIAAGLIVAPAFSLRATGVAGPHVWSQHEIARIALPDRIGLDRAAQLTAAREYSQALEILRSSHDSLRAGYVACKAEQYRAAIDLLQHAADNPYLEWFRLYSLAKALCAEQRYAESDSVLEVLFAMNGGTVFSGKCPALRKARDLSAEVIARSDSLLTVKGIPEDTRLLSPRPLFLLSRALLERGNDSTAVALFTSITWWKMQPFDLELFAELLGRFKSLYPTFSSDDLYSVGRRAIDCGLYAEAEDIIDSLLRRVSTDSRALLLRGVLLEAQHHPQRAIAVFDDIFNSSAPQRVREEAIERSASIEYTSKNYERAVEKYLMCGGTRNNELAARIEISLGDYERAVGLLEPLRPPLRDGDAINVDLGPPVCEAALRLWRGDSAAAYQVLKATHDTLGALFGRPARVRGPDLYYWLSRTCRSDTERIHWSSKLTVEHPASFYAADLGEGVETLLTASDPDARRARVDALARAERRLIDSLDAQVPPDDPFVRTAVFRAYRYLLDCGLIGEASDCCLIMQDSLMGNWRRPFTVYEEARGRGFYQLAIWIANRPGWSGIAAQILERLSYPVAFADLIACDAVNRGLPPEVILAVMREESKFDPYATSGDGALGLMQLMPATARWTARKSGVRGITRGRLFEPAFNIETGCRYLRYLLDRFDGSLVGALAAYNGGEGKMARWKNAFDPLRDPVMAVEMIGPLETRRYVEKVLESIFAYRSLGRAEAQSK